MKRIIFSLIIAIPVSNLTAQTVYSNAVEAQIKQVENNLAGEMKIEGMKGYNISDRMAYYKVKGLSVAVIKDYKVVWAKGYGWADEQEKRPVTTETLFEPGSISKSINSLGVLKLVQDKKLDLNTDINTYLKSWQFPYDSVSKGKKITIANLLSHSAGLTVHGFGGYNRKATVPTLTEILDGKKPANSAAVRSQFEPGLRYEYSGGGTVISQLILADITHTPYDQFIENTVFKPLGMRNSFYTQPPPADKLNLVATGYRIDGSMVDDKFHVYPEQGAAGLWTTPSDLCKYIIETQLAYQGKSAKVLNQEMTKIRLTPYNDKSVALGVFIEDRNGVKYFQHSAANEGFRGIYYGSLEEGNGVVAFVNSDNGNILQEVMNSVADVYNWKGFYQPVIKKVVDVPDNILEKYQGIYQVANNTFLNIMKKEDGYYQFGEGAYAKIYFTNQNDFFSLEYATSKSFITDSTGQVTGFLRTVKGQKLPPAVKIMNPDTLKGSNNFFNSVGWNLLQNKNYDEAIKYLQRGLKLYPNTLFMEGNLAHCYLFKGDYDGALKIYKAHVNESVDANMTWNKMIQEDFTFFKNNKFDTSVMDKIFADLKLEVPEDYKTK